MRHSHESSISSVSLTLVGIIASSIFMLAGNPTLKSEWQSAQLSPELTPNQVPELRHVPPQQSQQQPEVVDLMPAAQQAPTDERMAEIATRFEQAAIMLHAERFNEAMVALHRVLQLSPRLPEAHANMGYALMGLEDYEAAYDFFDSATELDPYLGNAYWGKAVVMEKLGNLEGALGAMRIYIHLAEPNDPYVRRARSALWEWDSQLARGPLPQHEAEWIDRRNREWDERNLPDRDSIDPGEVTIPVRDVQ